VKRHRARRGATALDGAPRLDGDLDRYDEAKQFYSGKASDVVRSAAFAGVALVWALRAPTTSTLQRPLLHAATLFAATIALDVLQYVAGTIIWTGFYWFREWKDNLGTPEPPGHRPSLHVPIYLFFVLKVVAAAWGYVVVFQYLWTAWGQPVR
jgi:hypothetical protein